ncbi:coiled-coil domain-containing protein 7-like [Octodon degus]|uniref:Coiled-coil domain-containing protein 7-like n=1 Tax=Octodon degus TaxID=10160 RepID=A0A6P6DCN6_OCTDE|nr:coiled-coil domain-containing protein 7-like [Octodon degus]
MDTQPLAGIIGKSIKKAPMKTQLKSYPETDTVHLTDMFRGGKVFNAMKTQPQSHHDSNTEPLVVAIARGIIMGSDGPQLESPPDTDKELLADTVGESILKEPVKTQFMGVPGMSLLKNKGMFMQHQKDIYKHPVLSKLPTKLFLENQENFEDSSPYLTEPPKAIHNTSKIASQNSRFTPFPPLNKMPSAAVLNGFPAILAHFVVEESNA